MHIQVNSPKATWLLPDGLVLGTGSYSGERKQIFPESISARLY